MLEIKGLALDQDLNPNSDARSCMILSQGKEDTENDNDDDVEVDVSIYDRVRQFVS